jgi:hypothetical protein
MEETSELRRSKRILLSPSLKKLLVYHCCHLESTAEFVKINLFGTNDNPPSLQYPKMMGTAENDDTRR